MPRRCTICDHGQRAEIDLALVRGRTALRDVAGRFGLSKSAVERHKAEHTPKILTDAAEAEGRLTAADLLNDLRELQRTARRIGEKAEADGDLPTALRAVAELRGLLAVGLKAVESFEIEERLDLLEQSLSPDRRTG